MLARVAQLYNTKTVQSLMCFCCDQIYTDVRGFRHQCTFYGAETGEGRAGTEIHLSSVEYLLHGGILMGSSRASACEDSVHAMVTRSRGPTYLKRSLVHGAAVSED